MNIEGEHNKHAYLYDPKYIEVVMYEYIYC